MEKKKEQRRVTTRIESIKNCFSYRMFYDMKLKLLTKFILG